MKKCKIIGILIASIVSLSIVSTGIYFLMSYIISKNKSEDNSLKNEINNDEDEKKNRLTNEIVKNNFAQSGIWEDKDFLDYNEFLNYEYIDIDAFNNINKNIKYIELPSYLRIYDDNNNKMDWYTINLIKVKSYNNNCLFIENNILYQNLNFRNTAYTISDRNNTGEVKLNNFNNVPTSIYKNFYDEIIFKNVNLISFSKDFKISSIGDKAFLNCKILQDNINLYSSSSTYIGYQSFKNSNIKSFSIVGNWKTIIIFNEEVFCDSKNLNNFWCLNFMLSAWTNNLFQNVNNSFSFNDNSFVGYFNSKTKLIGNNNFDKLSLNLFYCMVVFEEKNDILFDGINVLNESNFKMNGYISKSFWENKGLNQSLLEKYNQVKINNRNIFR